LEMPYTTITKANAAATPRRSGFAIVNCLLSSVLLFNLVVDHLRACVSASLSLGIIAAPPRVKKRTRNGRAKDDGRKEINQQREGAGVHRASLFNCIESARARFCSLAPSRGLEACLNAHFVSRTLRRLGHTPRIIPAIYVKPFTKGQKNDDNDAEAIAEAALRPNLRVVQEKTQDQFDLQALHRVRARLVSRPTATINQIRAFLIEHGIAVRTGANALRGSLFAILENRADELSPRMSDLIVGLYEDWLWLDERIETLTGEIEQISHREANCKRLMSIPGVGPIISTAMVAAIGTGEAFERGRDFRRLAGPRASTIQHRRQVDPRAHLQAREQIPAHALHPGRQRHSHAAAKLGALQLRGVAEGGTAAPTSQQAGDRARQQARPHRLERAEAQHRLQRPSR
jgi:transposase